MTSSARRAVWTIPGRMLLAVLAVWAIASLYVSASFLWTPQGSTGLASNYGGEITSVEPGSPAERAGLKPGDRIILTGTSFENRPKVIGNATPIAPGTVVRFRVSHGASDRDVMLTAAEARLSLPQRLSLLFASMSAAVFIIVGASLIFLRPSLVTWGFGLFSLLSNPVVPALSHFPSAGAHLTYVAIYDVLQNVGVIGLLVFALNFPKTLRLPWRSLLVRSLPIVFVVLSAWTLWIDLSVCVFAVSSHEQNVALQLAFGVVDAVAVWLISETYVKGPAENRPRLRWVLVGFYFGLVCNYIGNTLTYTSNVALPGWIDASLVAAAITLPLAVSYAIVRHRVIEIDLFISRALVYAIFTTVLVLVFGATDWIFTQLISDFRLSIVFDACISIGLAFVFDRAQKVLERGVGRIVFRARQIAWDRLERTSKTFRHVTEPSSIDVALCREPHEALEIDSVALFRISGTTYRRIESRNWPEGDCSVLLRDDRLVLEHLSVDGPRYLADIPWYRDDLPKKLAAPVVSIPLQCANELAGLLLCSVKRNGEQLAPEELRKLDQLATSAAVAYDRLDAEELRAKAQGLERDIEVLRAKLEQARIDTGRNPTLA